MFCTACAAANPPASRSCRRCGNGLQGRAAPVGRAAAAGLRRRLAPVLYGLPVLVLLTTGAAVYRAARAEPAAWYARAEAAVVAGSPTEALAAYTAAAGYRDAETRREAVAAAFAPHRAAYEAAVAAAEAGDDAAATALVAPVVAALPGYEEARLLLAHARAARADALWRQAAAAEGRRDWLAAERALAALAAVAPADANLDNRLAALRRAHAPLVFSRDRALYLVGPGGADERLFLDAVPAAWPTWSPDRTRVAFTSPEADGGIALYVVGTEGASPTRLAGGLRPYAGPVWSPDGARIAYAAAGGWGGRDAVGAPDPAGVRVVEVATGRVTDVTGGRVRDALYPSWSPGGDRLAFVSRAADAGGGYDPPPASVDPVAPAPDGIAPAGEVYVATLATGAIVDVSGGRVLNPWRVAWSPADDRLLVYTRDPGMSYDRDRARLVLIDPVTGALRDLPTGGETVTMPVWSPTGDRLAYVAGQETVVIRAPDGETRRLDLGAPISRFLAWSPDAGALVAVAESAGSPSFLVPLDGDPRAAPSPLRLDHDVDRRHAGAPQWSPTNPAPPPRPPTVAGTALDHG
ncbi:MAG: hypothetical protein AVDCRST_MAG19-4904 [uncultured Thermomicrobiales bacterium]|uniref:TolB protein, periplasmic protein involved in the tonb-independent uptake of group A colicins n=1 Tax=uncultured Thermomicrobiales bacterium TaxID=1645740 RepID=A0A6J4VS80_9BACT|nr:MAG: hypothetical protein AVDCRST_MAG19-4904 [uncultured Thermomicrobiales bacterium]